MIAHSSQFIQPKIADTNVAPFSLPSRRGELSRLKLEIAVAVWNWEVRRGFPHYDGSWGGVHGRIATDMKLDHAENRVKLRHAANGLKT